MEFNNFGQPNNYEELYKEAKKLGLDAPEPATAPLPSTLDVSRFGINQDTYQHRPSFVADFTDGRTVFGQAALSSSLALRGVFDPNRPEQKTGIAGFWNEFIEPSKLAKSIGKSLVGERPVTVETPENMGWNPYRYAQENNLTDNIEFFTDKTTPEEAARIKSYVDSQREVAQVLAVNPKAAFSGALIGGAADFATFIPLASARTVMGVAKTAAQFAGLSVGQTYLLENEKATLGSLVAAAGFGAALGGVFGGLSLRAFNKLPKAKELTPPEFRDNTQDFDFTRQMTSIEPENMEIDFLANREIPKATVVGDTVVDAPNVLNKDIQALEQTIHKLPGVEAKGVKWIDTESLGKRFAIKDKETGELSYIQKPADAVDFVKTHDLVEVLDTPPADRFLAVNKTIKTVGKDTLYVVKTVFTRDNDIPITVKNPLGAGRLVTDDISYVRENAKTPEGKPYLEHRQVEEKLSSLKLADADAVIGQATKTSLIKAALDQQAPQEVLDVLNSSSSTLKDVIDVVNTLELTGKQYKAIMDNTIVKTLKDEGFDGVFSDKMAKSKLVNIFEKEVNSKEHKVDYSRLKQPSKVRPVNIDDYKLPETIKDLNPCKD